MAEKTINQHNYSQNYFSASSISYESNKNKISTLKASTEKKFSTVSGLYYSDQNNVYKYKICETSK